MGLAEAPDIGIVPPYQIRHEPFVGSVLTNAEHVPMM
jgi:hypothetical protein